MKKLILTCSRLIKGHEKVYWLSLVAQVGMMIQKETTTEGTVEMIATIVLFVGFVAQIYDPLQSMSEIFSDFMNRANSPLSSRAGLPTPRSRAL